LNPQNVTIGDELPIICNGVNILDVVDQHTILKIFNAGLEDMFSFCQLLARLEFFYLGNIGHSEHEMIFVQYN